LPPRGSARAFTRVQCGTRRAIVINYSLDRPENALYVRLARFLVAHGIRAPKVLLDRPAERVCVLEDAGTQSLQELVPTLSRRRCLTLYRRTLDHVLRLHGPASEAARRGRLALSKAFDRRLYAWEHGLFIDEFLQRRVVLDDVRLAGIRRELSALIAPQLQAPRVLIHRDLQSSNVLVLRGQPVLIDFQGMRFGSAAYDLASLLCDPYVNLPADMRDELLDYYVARADDGERVRRLFWIAAVQRLTQALGAFGRLGAIPATAYFLRHVPAGVRQYLHALDRTAALPILRKTVAAWYGGSADSDGNP
jgi:aminoglycoside/choline kinase family phosphotransferase